nr:hypothetical protein [Methylomarinum sp. Ch1-1]MDP4523024.1 hypothetical protein [Methylomarinum sp. Ch1-1]
MSSVSSLLVFLGLIRREEQGIAKIGTESAAIIVLYGIGVIMMLTGVFS